MSYVSSILIVVLFLSLAGLPWIFRQGRYLQTRSWPNVQGLVESAWVSLEQRGQSRFFKGKLAYSYSVDNQHFTGEIQRNFGGSEEKANVWVAQFSHGLPVEVRYNPNNSADSSFDERNQRPTA
jgi:Protein of unknown function (DUF3592)